jgi:hypothetical protein
VIIPQEALAKSDYKPDMNYKNYNHLSIPLATHSKPNIEIWLILLEKLAKFSTSKNKKNRNPVYNDK